MPRWWPNNLEYEAQKRRVENVASHGRESDRKYWISLLLYGVLAVLCWFTVGEGTIVVFGKPVELRLIPILILALFALRTMLVHQANKIRHSGD